MTRPSSTAATVRAAIDRANTNPVCLDCGYRTRAVDAYRAACPRCGQFVACPNRVLRALATVFGGRIMLDGGNYADRT